MAQQIINVGNTANDGTGSPLRSAFTIVNQNFTELYNLGGVSGIANGTSNIQIFENSSINMSSAGVDDVLVVTATGVNIQGELQVDPDISATGNITAGAFIGDGSQLTGVVSLANAALLTFNTLSSNVVNSSLTSVGVLTSLSVAGNIQAGNVLTAGVFSTTGNVQAANLRTSGTVSAAGNIQTTANALVQGYVSAQGNVAATGNVSGTYIIGNGAFITGLEFALNAPANLLLGTTLSSNVVNSSLRNFGIVSNITVANSLGGSGNADVGNVNTGGQVTATGNITGGNINSAAAVSATGAVVAGSVQSGTTVSANGNVIGGNVTTAGQISAQGNITTSGVFIGNGSQLTSVTAAAVGTLPSLSVTGNANVGAVSTAGNISASFYIGNGQLLTGIVATELGNITSLNITGTVAAGNLNSANLLTAGSANPANSTSTTSGTLQITGGAGITGNIYNGGLISAVGSIRGGNLLTPGNVSATGTIDAGNINVIGAGGILKINGTTEATSNVTGSLQTLGGAGIVGNVFVGGLLSVYGAVTGANAVTFSATTDDIGIGNSQTTGNIVMGSTIQTGTITIGQTTANAVLNIGTGTSASDRVKTINIANGGVANSRTLLNLANSLGNTTVDIAGGVTTNTYLKTVSIAANGAAGSITAISFGPTLGVGSASFSVATPVGIGNTGGTALSVAGNIIGANAAIGGTANIGSLAVTGPAQFTTTTGIITIGNALTSGSILIGTNPNQTGNIFIGNSTGNSNTLLATGNTQSGSVKNVFLGTGGADGSATNIYVGSNTNAAGAVFIQPAMTLQVANVGAAALSVAGNITGGNLIATGDVYTAFSDERLKANVNPITDPLAKLMTIRGVTFQPNDTAASYGFNDPKVQVGVLAQDVERVIPEVIRPAPFDLEFTDTGETRSRSGENYKTIQYERMIPLLIEAIKELKSEVDALRGKV